MAYSRVFVVLELELSTQLAFSFCVLENLSRPGTTTIRANDSFRFGVWVTNNSAIPLKTLQGTISSSALAEFPATPFHLPRLRPRKSKQIATIEARITRHPGHGVVRFNEIGTVKVAISPDLSQYRIEKSRPLTYGKTA